MLAYARMAYLSICKIELRLFQHMPAYASICHSFSTGYANIGHNNAILNLAYYGICWHMLAYAMAYAVHMPAYARVRRPGDGRRPADYWDIPRQPNWPRRTSLHDRGPPPAASLSVGEAYEIWSGSSVQHARRSSARPQTTPSTTRELPTSSHHTVQDSIQLLWSQTTPSVQIPAFQVPHHNRP